MDFNLSDEQQMLRDAANRFVREQYGFEARRHLATSTGWSPERWAQYADMGWLALGIPEDCGGLGCGFVETAIVAEELGRGLVLEPYIGCAVLAARLLETADAPGFAARRSELLQTWRPERSRSRWPTASPAAASNSTRVAATARAEGSGFVLDGVEADGARCAASRITSSCRRCRRWRGRGAVPRPAATPWRCIPTPLIDGTRAADVELRSVLVGADARLTAAAARASHCWKRRSTAPRSRRWPKPWAAWKRCSTSPATT